MKTDPKSSASVLFVGIAFLVAAFTSFAGGLPASPMTPAAAGDVAPVHRFWCAWGEHVYSLNEAERNSILDTLPCGYEGIGWYAHGSQQAGTLPVHRFWCSWGEHFYTIDEQERLYVESSLPCGYEGVAWYAYPDQQPGSAPTHRFNCAWGGHFYTINETEKAFVETNLPCTYEGVGWYGYAGRTVYGLDVGLYTDADEDPIGGGSPITPEELERRLKIAAPYADWIRTFGCNSDLKQAGELAHRLGKKAAVGAWLDSDTANNQAQVQCLVEAAKGGHVDLAIVGSEVLFRGDLSETALIGYINQVKTAVPGLPVAYADTYTKLLEHPAVLSASDVILANGYPYWEGLAIADALPSVQTWYQRVVSAASGKPVIISETGWPSAGNTVGTAVPSLENASRYFTEFTTWARDHGVACFYFAAFDEPYKERYEGPQGAHWGIMDSDGQLKPGMGQVFVAPAD